MVQMSPFSPLFSEKASLRPSGDQAAQDQDPEWKTVTAFVRTNNPYQAKDPAYYHSDSHEEKPNSRVAKARPVLRGA